MSTEKGIWFVYRSHYDGPLSKRVRRIDAPSILTWFQEKLADARGSATPRDVADADLGGQVHGFGRLLAAAKEHKLAAPKSTAALRAMLHKHLHVEGGPVDRARARPRGRDAVDNIRLDDHTLRVLTDDGEVELAYYFFDDEAQRVHGDRIAWLLEEDPELIDIDGDEAEGEFVPPVPVATCGPAGEGEGATYACLLTFHDGQSIPGAARVLPGVRLPGLAAHMTRVVPVDGARARPTGRDAAEPKPAAWSAESLETWPIELRLLRAMIGPEDTKLSRALRRAAAYPIDAVVSRGDHARLGIGPHAEAFRELTAAAEGTAHGGEPEKSIVHEGEHVAVLCAHASKHLGYQQWIFFDDIWAAAYPDLAGSLLLYATEWDPFPAEDGPRSRAAAAKSVQERAFLDALEGRPVESARRYRPSERFGAGELIDHAKFGLGVVKRVDVGKIEVIFRDANRTLAHGAG